MYNTDTTGSDAWVLILIVIVAVCVFIYVSGKNKSTGTTALTTVAPGKTAPLSFWNCHTIKLPSGLKWNARRTITLFTNLLNILGSGIILRITHENGEILFQIIEDRTDLAPHIVSAIRSVYPEAIVETTPLENPRFRDPFTRFILPLRQGAEYFRPLKTALDIDPKHDPLALFANVMDFAENDERVSFLMCVGEADRVASEQAWLAITQSRAEQVRLLSGLSSSGSWEDFIWSGIGSAAGGAMHKAKLQSEEAKDPLLRQPKYEKEGFDAFKQKVFNPLYHATLCIEIDAADRQRIGQFFSLVSLLNEYDSEYALIHLHEDFDSLILDITSQEDLARRDTLAMLKAALLKPMRKGSTPRKVPELYSDFLLSIAELASFWHLAHEDFAASKIGWAKKEVSMPSKMAGQTDGVCLGTNQYGGRVEKVYMRHENRVSHTYVVGRTRMGKSNLFHHLLTQDIEQGYGVCVVDPHGELVRDILRWSIPAGRENDVVVFELADQNPLPLNMLAYPPDTEPDRREAIAGQLMSVFKRYGNFGDTVTLEPALWNCLLLLQAATDPTLRDIKRVLTDNDYRYSLMDKLDGSPAQLDYWSAFNSKYETQQTLTTSPLIDRVSRFYGTNNLYHMTCHPETLDFAKLINDGKIILLSLRDSDNKWSEYQRELLGGILVTQIQMGAMSRQYHAKPFYLYIDEAELFVSAPIDKILSQAGKYSLSLTLASQHLSQLRGDTLKGVMGNIGAMIAFRIGQDDARELHHYLPKFEIVDLVNLDKGNAAANMQHFDQTHTFSLKTLPPLHGGITDDTKLPPEVLEREKTLRELSRQTYTPMTRHAVAAHLAKKYPKPREKGTPTRFEEVGDNLDAEA